MSKVKKFGDLGTIGNLCENMQEPSVSFNLGQHAVRAPPSTPASFPCPLLAA